MNRSLLIAAIVVAVVVGVAVAANQVFFGVEDATPVPTTQSSPTPGDTTIRVARLEGAVEFQDANGDWQPVSPGTELSKDSNIRAAAGASAVVEMGDHATITLAERSEVRLSEVTERLSTLVVGEGRISAVVHGGGASKLEVRVRNSDTVAEATSGAFTVLTDGNGQVAVASQSANVNLTAKGQSVQVEPQQQSIVLPDAPPAAPTRIPTALLLKVGRPKNLATRRKTTTVRGSATPGSMVRVNGEPVRVAADGSFSAKVALAEGDNKIVVAAVDASGHEKVEELPTIHLDSRAPKGTTEVKWE